MSRYEELMRANKIIGKNKQAEGRAARKAGMPASSNPYKSTSPDSDSWLKGFNGH